MSQETTTEADPVRSLVSTQHRTTMITFLALMIGTLYFALKMVQPFLLAVTMGAILATLALKPYRWLRNRGLGRKLASLLVTMTVVLIIIGPLAGFVEIAIGQASTVLKSISSGGGLSLTSLVDRFSDWLPIRRIVPDPEAVERQIMTTIQNAGKALTGSLLGLVSNVPSMLLQLALTGLSCFFFLIDGRKFLDWTMGKLPLDRDVETTLIFSLKNTTISVIVATLAAASVQAVLMLASFLVLGMPLAVLAAGATFVFAWVPILGSAPVWIAGVIYLYVKGMATKAVLMLIFGLIIGVSDNLVRPWVLKGRGEMHPLVSLVAIFGGIEMFGMLGVFLGPVIAAVVIALLQTWPAFGRRFGLLPLEPPIPASQLVKENGGESGKEAPKTGS